MTGQFPNSGDLRIPDPPARLHFVGIGGIGVSGLARLLRARGYAVTGSDMAASEITRSLEAEGIEVSIGHAAGQVRGADFVITTAAAAGDNVELIEASRLRVPVVKRAAVLGLLARSFRSLAVAGSHGKSTTSGMAAVALDAAGHRPGFAVGAVVPHFGTNARDGEGDYFVVEADEYDYSFLQLEPDVAIITNIEHDHPDLFPDLSSVLGAFEAFVRRIRPGGTLVLSGDDPGCQSLRSRFGTLRDVEVVTFGGDDADWVLEGGSRVRGPGGQTFELPLAVPGRHNRLNALAVLAAAGGLGVRPEELLPGLARFAGVGRRFEIVLETDSLVVVNDYAHHPTEIGAPVGAARERYPGRRVVVVFQPHTYSRTRAFVDEFAAALDQGDMTILTDIYPARETDNLGVSSASIAERMTGPVQMVGSPDDAVQRVAEILKDGDVVLVLGAGDIYLAAASIAGNAK
ncbi:MAG: UDP-N-acetylmuramate--L-alanine ligase [Thermomicrobiales bacterium]